MGVQMVANRYAATGVVGRGAAVSLGGLRLVGGSLATVGGVMLAFIDFQEGDKALKKRVRILGGAYFARGILSLGMSVLAGMVALSFTGPLLRFIFGQNSQLGFIKVVEGLAVSRLPPIMLKVIGAGSLITLGISVAIIYLSPSKMEEWCWHSCFKKAGGFLKPFENQEKELQNLYEALKEVS